MLGEIPIRVIGNLTDDPVLRYTASGVAVATFTVASTERQYSQATAKYEDAGTTYLRCNIWREQAENAANSLTKGMRVIVTGILRQRPWETKEGEKRSTFEIQADEVGVSLRWATVKTTKTGRSTGPVPDDPWARPDRPGGDGPGPEPGGHADDPPPF
jgi:single-strand DNA-binding protein